MPNNFSGPETQIDLSHVSSRINRTHVSSEKGSSLVLQLGTANNGCSGLDLSGLTNGFVVSHFAILMVLAIRNCFSAGPIL